MMNEGLIAMMAGITEILGIIFIIFCTLKKYFSWAFLLLGQGIWLSFSYYGLDKIDLISLLMIAICLSALLIWRETIFGYSTLIERIIIIGSISLIILFICLFDSNLRINEILCQMFTVSGICFLSMKCIDGWIVLGIANFFYWQNTLTDTLAVIILGCMLYGFGFYYWRKEVT